MTSLTERIRKLGELPLPGRHSSGVQIGIQRENARLRPLLEALSACSKLLGELKFTDLGEKFSSEDRLRVNETLTELKRVVAEMEGK